MTLRDERRRLHGILRALGLALVAVFFLLPHGATIPEQFRPFLEGRPGPLRAFYTREGAITADTPLLIRIFYLAHLPWIAWAATLLAPRLGHARRRAARVILLALGACIGAVLVVPLLARVLEVSGAPSGRVLYAVPFGAAMTTIAIVLLAIPRRRLRVDPMPLAAAQAVACAVPWVTGFVLEMLGPTRDIVATPGAWVLVAGLLIFALPSYLPRRRRRDRLGAPTLAAPAAAGAAP